MEDSNLQEDVRNDQTSDDGQQPDEGVFSLSDVNSALEEAGLPGTFKSKDALVKSLLHAKKLASQGGMTKTKEKKADGDDDKELLLSVWRQANPDADLVWDELKARADRFGVSPVKLYQDDKEYFTHIAQRRAEEKRQKENEVLLTKPAESTGTSKDYSRLSFEQIEKITDRKERIKAYEAVAKRK